MLAQLLLDRYELTISPRVIDLEGKPGLGDTLISTPVCVVHISCKACSVKFIIQGFPNMTYRCQLA